MTFVAEGYQLSQMRLQKNSFDSEGEVFQSVPCLPLLFYLLLMALQVLNKIQMFMAEYPYIVTSSTYEESEFVR